VSKWDMTDEQLIDALRALGNSTRSVKQNYERTIYDVAADRIAALLAQSREGADLKNS
jgi:hypothetical protein